MEPTCAISDPNLAPKTDPKSIFLGFQDLSYLKISKNVTIVPTLKRKPRFCSPKGAQNLPKIDNKSILRGFYVGVVFRYPFERALEPSRRPFGADLSKISKILGPKMAPTWPNLTDYAPTIFRSFFVFLLEVVPRASVIDFLTIFG